MCKGGGICGISMYVYKRGFLEKNLVCIKGGDKETHHPSLTLDWGYTPPTKGKRHSWRYDTNLSPLP